MDLTSMEEIVQNFKSSHLFLEQSIAGRCVWTVWKRTCVFVMQHDFDIQIKDLDSDKRQNAQTRPSRIDNFK